MSIKFEIHVYYSTWTVNNKSELKYSSSKCFKMSKALNHFNKVTFQFPIVRKMYSSILKQVKWPDNSCRIMDIGCGSGRVLLEVLEPLLPKYYTEIIGTDISNEMITFCKNLKRDRRISFEILDIETQEIPQKFQNNFDFLFSCFVLHYIRDLRKALWNCNKLLKHSGQLAFIFMYTSHPLYEIYRRMCIYGTWIPYTKNYENYVPFSTSDDPRGEMKIIFKECGLEIIQIELNHDPYESTAENFLTLFNCMDGLHATIPERKKEKYHKDFKKTFGEIAGFSVQEKDMRKKVHMYFPTIVVHAKKCY